MTKSLLSRTYWILGITIFATVAAYIYTLPSINKPLILIQSTLYSDVSNAIGIDNKYIVKISKGKDFANSVIEEIGSETGLTAANYNKRVVLSTSTGKNMILSVKADDAEKAYVLSMCVSNLLNLKICEIASSISAKTINDSKVEISFKTQQIDSLKREIEKIDQQVAAKVKSNGSDRFIEHKLLLEKNPDYIFAKNLMEKYANDLGTSENNYNKAVSEADPEHIYISVIEKPEPQNAVKATNRTKIVLITAILSLICVACVFIVIDKIKISKQE